MRHRVPILVAFVCFAAVVMAAEVETVSRVFRLEYLSVSEASAVVQPMLSEIGSLTVQPSQARMTVQDVPEVIDRVARLIDKLDHAPGRYRIQIDLLEGGAKEPYGTVLQVELDARLQKMFKAASFRRLGSSVLEGEIGSSAQAEIGNNFLISFLAQEPEYSKETPWGSPDPGDRIHLRRLVLGRVVVGSDGTRTTEELLRTNVLLSPNQKVYIGAGKSEESENVLVLIVYAQEFGGR
jgi:hypothetical protein